ncbi:MAG TPA: hypothetical protein VIG99_21690 [Myxococcaceae bacterium]
MLLFQKRFHAGLAGGSIRLTFRSWSKPLVKAGGRYRCHPLGVLEVDRVEVVRVGGITAGDARLAGFESREALLEYMQAVREAPLRARDQVFRVELHHGGDGDRVPVALDADLTDEEVAALVERLDGWDARAKVPWVWRTLRLIGKHPRVAASKLAKRVGRETLPFKQDVRRLKKLGLTQSFEVGYELSPRGAELMRRKAKTRKRPASPV